MGISSKDARRTTKESPGPVGHTSTDVGSCKHDDGEQV
jgi:hypothetical protein